jgi:hypothetical protein
MSEFPSPPEITTRTKALAEEIKQSGEVNPLIVMIDEEGPYILEGGHRYDALKILGAKSFPAIVVIDEGAFEEPEIEPQASPKEPEKPNITAHITREQAMETNVPMEMPTRPEFEEAVRNTPAATITPDGLLIKLVRYQKEDQAGEPSVRTGVFYLPEGAASAKHYRTGKTNYGGKEKMEGETLLRRPLFVKGATGGKAPEVAYESIKGKGSMKQLDRDVMSVVTSKTALKERGLFEENVKNFLRDHGADPYMAWNIVANSREGNQLRYALQENVIAHAVREAGYDSVLGFSKGKNGPFISEVFDVREQTYPANNFDSEVHEKF